MAAGDIVRDSDSPRTVGNLWLLTGTIEVDATKRTFALTSTKSTLISVDVVDKDGIGSAQVEINEAADGTDTNGSVAVMGNHVSVDTYYYRAYFI